MEHLQGLTDACLSGGADGSDLEWGRCASAAGHAVIHWSFPDHPSNAPESQLVRLSDEQLELGRAAIENAADALGKHPPERTMVTRLVYRNFYQVAWSSACYAVTAVRENEVRLPADAVRGTAWAVKMFQQLHPGNRSLYVFDQERDAWLKFNGETWDQIESPPRPAGIWAGIGSRDLKENGRAAIQRLMGCSAEDETAQA